MAPLRGARSWAGASRFLCQQLQDKRDLWGLRVDLEEQERKSNN